MSIVYRSSSGILTALQTALDTVCTWALGGVYIGDVDVDIESGHYKSNTPFVVIRDGERRKLTKPTSTGCAHRSLYTFRIAVVVSDNSPTVGNAVTTAQDYLGTIIQAVYNMGLPSYARDLALIQELATRKPTWTIYAVPLPYQVAEAEFTVEVTDGP